MPILISGLGITPAGRSDSSPASPRDHPGGAITQQKKRLSAHLIAPHIGSGIDGARLFLFCESPSGRFSKGLADYTQIFVRNARNLLGKFVKEDCTRLRHALIIFDNLPVERNYKESSFCTKIKPFFLRLFFM